MDAPARCRVSGGFPLSKTGLGDRCIHHLGDIIIIIAWGVPMATLSRIARCSSGSSSGQGVLSRGAGGGSAPQQEVFTEAFYQTAMTPNPRGSGSRRYHWGVNGDMHRANGMGDQFVAFDDVSKIRLFPLLVLKPMIILPRQARDKHKENSNKAVFSGG